MDAYYSPSSASDVGTLYHMRNILKHKTVKKKVMDNVNHVVELINAYTSGMITLLAMKILNMGSLDDSPISSPAWDSDDIKADYIMDVSKKIVESIKPVVDHNSVVEGADEQEDCTSDDICVCDNTDDIGNQCFVFLIIPNLHVIVQDMCVQSRRLKF